MISPDEKPMEPQKLDSDTESSHDASRDPLPASKRIYITGSIYSELQVPMREISQSDTKGLNGKVEVNEPVRVYDCSGPWGDPEFKGSVEEGLPALRHDWILKRGDVESYDASYDPYGAYGDAYGAGGMMEMINSMMEATMDSREEIHAP
ncbi:MAG: hypothetical protein ACO3SO_06125, partial [Luteolibacter sp.]